MPQRWEDFRRELNESRVGRFLTGSGASKRKTNWNTRRRKKSNSWFFPFCLSTSPNSSGRTSGRKCRLWGKKELRRRRRSRSSEWQSLLSVNISVTSINISYHQQVARQDRPGHHRPLRRYRQFHSTDGHFVGHSVSQPRLNANELFGKFYETTRVNRCYFVRMTSIL